MLCDLTGQRFGMLVVIGQAPTLKTRSRWICRCDCGTEKIVMGDNLRHGTTLSCGCKHRQDLTGQKIGKLTVIERSVRYGPRGARKTRLWKCQCECGEITYKATDTLTNPSISMCQKCAGQYDAQNARENAGFVGGTQISKIKNCSTASNNASGHRGVYFDSRTGKYRARLRFQGKLYSLGSFDNIDDAIKARKRGEEEIYGRFLEDVANRSQEGEVANMCEVLDKIVERGIAQKEAQVNERVAVDLLNANAPLNLIKIASKLSEETIRAIAKKIGVEVVEG